jgi:hypothetical protein
MSSPFVRTTQHSRQTVQKIAAMLHALAGSTRDYSGAAGAQEWEVAACDSNIEVAAGGNIGDRLPRIFEANVGTVEGNHAKRPRIRSLMRGRVTQPPNRWVTALDRNAYSNSG